MSSSCHQVNPRPPLYLAESAQPVFSEAELPWDPVKVAAFFQRATVQFQRLLGDPTHIFSRGLNAPLDAQVYGIFHKRMLQRMEEIQFPRPLVEATDHALTLHQEQTRKDGYPYGVHLLGTASLVAYYTENLTLTQGALLHDAAEDQGGIPTLREIEARFGAPVAHIVERCSEFMEDPDTDEKKPRWLVLKQHKLNLMRDPQTPPDALLVMAADGINNLEEGILPWVEEPSSAIWDRFTRGRHGICWYHWASWNRLKDVHPSHPLVERYGENVNRLLTKGEVQEDSLQPWFERALDEAQLPLVLL